MTGYWDIHNHILPGVDDGSGCMRETMEMLEEEYRQGVRHIVFTPHYRRDMFAIPREEIQTVYARVCEMAADRFPEMEFYLGCEYYIHSDASVERLRGNPKYYMAGSRTVLMEFAYEASYAWIMQTVSEVRQMGLQPVLAHAERYDEEFTVNDRSTELEVLYIDDLVEGMFDLLEGKQQYCEFDGVETVLNENGRYCCVPITHKATLGEIVDLLEEFKSQPISLMMPKCPDGSFAKKLFSLYLTYLPTDRFKYAMKMNCDDRGSITELVHTVDCGQISINISKPGITKGQHWHNSKWEQFIVVHGHGLIQERNINTGETVEFEVSGDKIEAIYMIPGWTHNIINLSETDDLVTVMTCNEIFDPTHPDTFFDPV